MLPWIVRPCSFMASAVARPMPRPAPVTMAVLVRQLRAKLGDHATRPI